MLGERLERQHGIGLLDAFDQTQSIGNQVSHVIVAAGAHHDYQVIISGNRVNFRNLGHIGQLLRNFSYPVTPDVQ